MIFARYNGIDKQGEHFIVGKVYFGTPEIDGTDVVSMQFITINDESGKPVQVIPTEGRFEFFDEVYAVALKPFDEYQAGDVVILDNGEINGDTYVHIKGLGLRKASEVEVLDRTKVYPGIVIQDVSTGIWEPVMRVDECLWVVVEGQDMFRAPTEFRFAVSYDGELMSVPLVKCVDDVGIHSLTIGTIYHLKEINGDGDFIVKNDEGNIESYMPSRFQMG
jgi:hypothetical protein